MVLSDDIREMFDDIRKFLGCDVRKVELTDEEMCSLLRLSIGDYTVYVQKYVIKNNWAQLYGKNSTNIDLAFSLSMRSLDMTKDYSDWFSKQVGLQQHGKWELKKDFFTIEEGKQVYLIPAGRELNHVFWVTPPTTDAALWANYGGFSTAFGGGVMGQLGLGSAAVFGGMSSGYGLGVGLWALPAYDMSLMSADLSYKQQYIRSDLAYKVTAGPDGTHLVHLMSTPGSKLTFGAGGMRGYYPLKGCYVWYTYYDTNASNVDQCRKDNPEVILSPDQVPLEKADFELMNPLAKNIVRQILTGRAAQTLALIRGKFSGQIQLVGNTLQMDYAQLMSLGTDEIKEAKTELKEWLDSISPAETMKREADMSDDMLRIQKKIPLKIYVH
ncbi:MAG: hypothetical protein J6Y37_14700 [Paludibacteraceae bacterium]|nr:hypothetical protein [Paludibacteraceae bacterium]